MPAPEHAVLRTLEVRPEGDHFIVGRIDTGHFIDLPPVGKRALDLIGEVGDLRDVRRRLRDEIGEEVDVATFVGSLCSLDFVAELDGEPQPDSVAHTKVSFPAITASRVRWLVNPVLIGAVAGLVMTGAVVGLTHVSELPRPVEAVWSSWGSLVLVTSAALTWLLIFAHELAHLATARAYGVPSRITLGTRLQYLCAQTDVSGMWAKRRRQRMLVYLSGMLVTASVASLAVLCLVTSDNGVVRTAATVVFVSQLQCLLLQGRVFVRTDLYFVLQDVSRCRNLYTDGCRYLAYAWRRIRGRPTTDPTAHLSRRERLFVRGYAAFFGPSTVITLASYAFFSIPILVTLLVNAAGHAVAGDSWLMLADGWVTLTVLIGMKVLWARTWWRRHGPRTREYFAGRFQDRRR